MSTRNRVGYCPICKQNVLLVREVLNWPFMIILLIFTGIGLIIYLIIYYNKPESRCIHCHSKILLTSKNTIHSPSPIQTSNQLRQENEITIGDTVKEVKTLQQQLCSFCGERLLNKNAKFCPHCGTKV